MVLVCVLFFSVRCARWYLGGVTVTISSTDRRWVHNWTRCALGSWTRVQAGAFETTTHIATISFYTHTHKHAHTTGIHISCTSMYLIKGFGLILIVNCLLHPLFIANISGALGISDDPPPCSDINFNNDTRIRIYV